MILECNKPREAINKFMSFKKIDNIMLKIQTHYINSVRMLNYFVGNDDQLAMCDAVPNIIMSQTFFINMLEYSEQIPAVANHLQKIGLIKDVQNTFQTMLRLKFKDDSNWQEILG